MYSPWLWPSFIFWNTQGGKQVKYYNDILEDIALKVIKEKKEKYLNGESDAICEKRKGLVDLLLEKCIETHELSDQEIKEELKTFILAGHDTTATNICWALHLIGLHPDIQAKLHEEIDEIFGENVQRPITETDLKNLKYLDCVVKESLRLYPAVPFFARQVHEDTNICGHVIPKGSTCIAHLYYLHRDEDVFPEPEKFNPDRFLPENSAKIPEYGYLPFSAGARSCIGFKYAELEVKTFICSILRRFSIETLDEREMQPLMKIVLHPSMPMRIRIRRRFNSKH